MADTGHHRLLAWRNLALADNTRVGILIGQDHFASKGDNAWGLAGRQTLCRPYGLSVLGPTAAVADSGNNRVLLWSSAI